MTTRKLCFRFGLASLCLIAATVFAPVVVASEDKSETAAPVAADSDAAIAAYPLDTCVVSGDKLEDGEMGPPHNYVYKQEGKPDRLVRLCCKGCIKKFNKAPDKYLKKIDDATSQAGDAGAVPADGHSGHKH